MSGNWDSMCSGYRNCKGISRSPSVRSPKVTVPVVILYHSIVTTMIYKCLDRMTSVGLLKKKKNQLIPWWIQSSHFQYRQQHPCLLPVTDLSWCCDSLLACLSQRAWSRMSQSRMVPLLLLYTKVLHCCGWNSAAVMTSVNSSILAGLMSTMSNRGQGVKRVSPLPIMLPQFNHSWASSHLEPKPR